MPIRRPQLVNGEIYHIVLRAIESLKLFRDEKDYFRMIHDLFEFNDDDPVLSSFRNKIIKARNVLATVTERKKRKMLVEILAFCLMPNHIHLLVRQLREGGISKFMRKIGAGYGLYYNQKYERKGHLFQERYKMVLLEKDPYLLMMTAYIHLNPKVLGRVKNLEDYPYSSYLLYIQTEYLKPQTETAPESLGLKREGEVQEVVERLAGSYADYISSIPKEQREELARELSRKGILGSEEFVNKVEAYMRLAVTTEDRTPKTKNRKIIMAGSLAVLVLGISLIFLYGANKQLKDKFHNLSHEKEMEYSDKLSQERTNIKKDLEEKHRADMVSFEAMAKRLEIEKKRVREVEEKLKSLEGEKK